MRISTTTEHMRRTRHISTVLAAVTVTIAVTACRGKEPAPSHAIVTCSLGMYRAAGQDICISGSCGDGRINQDEVCDDGNRIAGDGCSPDCASSETCGNGVVDQVVGEVCDDGNLASGDACCGDCRSCPELAMQVATESPHDSLPDTQPCPNPLAEALATPDFLMPPVDTPAPLDFLMPPVDALATSDVLMPPVDAPVAPTERSVKRRLARKIRALNRARADIAELQHTTQVLERSLETEREQHEELQERVARGRTDELD